ncbi:unnamed protein product [Acanthoscelides obtectus]|uniref:Uncharacterized protein n=1 Tax=Acanthoscelides obtectus TaxID=200917 RepID=A0A9P0PSC8_ACAOB|nr:unnamed protein product [Acanthoscelides obtectus]CAK1624432.1 hypothetical protein AOBTE_LOCUS2569 [Acanthoscelides obtectus]
MYLEEGLNITKMYKEHIVTNGAATVGQYREILNSEFNIAFFKPKNDQCQLCTAYKDVDNDIKLNMQ